MKQVCVHIELLAVGVLNGIKIGAATPTKINTNQFDENNSTITKVQDISVSPTDSDTAIYYKPKRCGNCDKTDGGVYTSIPPKVKCTITGKFHCYDDVCDCDTITATN